MLGYINLFILFSVFTFHGIDGAKILGIFPVVGQSHYLAGSTLMKILAEKGHDVTIISPFSEKNPPKNYKEVVLKGVYEKAKANAPSMFNIPMNPFLAPVVFSFVASNMAENVLNNTEFQQIMQSREKFDAIIIEEFNTMTLKYVAHHLNAPLIMYSALDVNEWINQFQGNPDSPAYSPNIYLPYPTHMTLFQRSYNSISYVFNYLVRNFITLPLQNRLLHKYYPDAPHLSEFLYNTSLVLLNADSSIHEPLPKVPSLINIGGFHIKKPKPLPKDLQDILDNAKHGVIFFSLGSNLKSVDMPIKKREILLETFAALKQTVIWKFEDEELPGKPDNVIIRKWLPQNDILAHKNVKLFITHGGIFSTMEAVYHGIPLLALPVLAEQELNSKRAEMGGYAKKITFWDITKDSLISNLNEVLSNPRYKQNANKRSQIMLDKPLTAAESVNFWVEYVIRHKGAPHLRVAALDLAWYEYLLIDVILFISVLLISIIFTIKYSLKLICKKKTDKKEKIN
ncbi:hypothetical protein HHI36_009222 [Cryptolaemus montrouzieri]|uniref:UDP-glucuronosyltransferase n=1 Tax=Cryptolaemus montrouzieri TaxID=559131 RepID=A0ABD2MUM7_9CUCU